GIATASIATRRSGSSDSSSMASSAATIIVPSTTDRPSSALRRSRARHREARLIMRPALLAACGGFLLAVLWMDLMFDVQMLGAAPEAAVASIAAYYRRVTTDARPMNQLIGVVMGMTILGAAAGTRDRTAGALRWLPPACAGAPVGLAAGRVSPNAARLGMDATPPAERLALARGICRDHLLCFALMATFSATQVLLTRVARRRA